MEKTQMRNQIVAAITVVSIIVTIAGAIIVDPNAMRSATAIEASAAIDVMQMMRDAKNLPEEQYDAF
jgi:hypothetical protein